MNKITDFLVLENVRGSVASADCRRKCHQCEELSVGGTGGKVSKALLSELCNLPPSEAGSNSLVY